MKPVNAFRTKDLSEASLLLTKSGRLLEIERDGNTCWFVFEDKKSCENLSDQFWFGECLVNAKSYYQAMATLKNRIFSRA